MKYVPPIGGAINAPYVDANPAAGTEGSAVPAAAIEHPMREIEAAILAAGLVPSTGNLGQLAEVIGYRIRHLGTGVALPAQNIGPCWHADYNSLMTWQAFTANGANYTGYASVLVGSLLLDTQPTPRAGYIKSGVVNLSRTAYAALRAWAMHNGIMVAEGAWLAGRIAVADNADGTTFKVFDVRGDFLRAWSDGSAVDSGRGFGTWQEDEFKTHAHVYNGTTLVYLQTGGTAVYANYSGATSSTGGVETKPRNTALLASIKF